LTPQIQALQKEIPHTVSQLQTVTSSLSQVTTTASQRAVAARYATVAQDLRADFDKSARTWQRAVERHELLGGASSSSSPASGDSGMESLLRERNHIHNSMNNTNMVLDQASAVHGDLRNQGRSLRSASQMVLQIMGNVPGVNRLVEQIRRRRSRDDQIVAAVMASCILFTLWYLFG